MIKKPDYLIYERPQVEGRRQVAGSGDKVYPMTEGVWQQEALDTLAMYGPGEGGFRPVKGEQLTLFPMEPGAEAKAVQKLDLDDPNLPVAHKDSFRWLSKDTLHQIKNPKLRYPGGPVGHTHFTDAVSGTQGQLIVDGVTTLKEDQFPGRVDFVKGGLYAGGDKKDPAVIERHRHAPNYRKMENKPVHGVGQPTKKGFEDVLTKLGAKDKPVVWTNMRAEAIVYVNGEPYNLREMASRENLVLKEGASGAEIEALEKQLKEKVIAKGSIEVPIEPTPKPPEKPTKIVSVTPENVQTTDEVISEMREKGYKVEYKRLPVADEKSPDPASLDALRQWMNDVESRNPEHKGKLEYVFNCHQGRGRTTTAMVAAGIALDGKTIQLKLPFVGNFGEDAEKRADRIIDENFHMQNLRETVDETKKRAADEADKARKAQEQADSAKDEATRAKKQAEADAALAEKIKYETRATDFTKRYALMQKYSEYIDSFGPRATTPSFDSWMKQTAQCDDLDKKWAALNVEFGLIPLQQGVPGMPVSSNVALA